MMSKMIPVRKRNLICATAVCLLATLQCAAVIWRSDVDEFVVLEKAKPFTSVVQVLLPTALIPQEEIDAALEEILIEDPSLASVFADLIEQEFITISTGVIIGTHTILTTADFALDFEYLTPSAFIVVAEDIRGEKEVYRVKRGHLHPLWKGVGEYTRDIAVSDMGILELDGEIDTKRFSIAALDHEDADVYDLTSYTRKDLGSTRAGRSGGFAIDFIGVGYGSRGEEKCIENFPDGRRRYYESIGHVGFPVTSGYTSFKSNSFVFDWEPQKAIISTDPREFFSLPFGGCGFSCDEGSPAFVLNSEAGRFEVFAIMSRVDFGRDEKENSFFSGTHFIPLFNHIEWILEMRHEIEGAYSELPALTIPEVTCDLSGFCADALKSKDLFEWDNSHVFLRVLVMPI